MSNANLVAVQAYQTWILLKVKVNSHKTQTSWQTCISHKINTIFQIRIINNFDQRQHKVSANYIFTVQFPLWFTEYVSKHHSISSKCLLYTRCWILWKIYLLRLERYFFFIMRLDGIHYSYTINQWHMIYICEFLKKKFLVKKIFFCFFVFWPLAIIWEKVVVRRKATKTLTWKKSKVQIIQKPFDRFYSDLVSWYNGQTELRNFYDVFEFFKSQMSHVKRLKWKLDDAVPIS